MAKYFVLDHLDAAICGTLPEGEMYSFEQYKKRMIAEDEQYSARIEKCVS